MFPERKRFAFTILDDTDDSRTENVEPVYALLRALGMRTTKTAWPLDCPEGSPLYWNADTLQDPRYRSFVATLANAGFEIASHCATMESSPRRRTEHGFEVFSETFGFLPTLHCNHGQNKENVYWGAARYTTTACRAAASMLDRVRNEPAYEGHVPGSEYFWGDLCRERFKYVRSFAFEQLDLSRIPPGRPYRLESTPYVNYWFTTADAPDVEHFKRLVTRERIDELVRNNGFTIVSTHLGKGFAKRGSVDPDVIETLRYLTKLDGWFVPVSQLLDFLLSRAATEGISRAELRRLELRHLWDRVRSKLP